MDMDNRTKSNNIHVTILHRTEAMLTMISTGCLILMMKSGSRSF